ncbi:MarR family transcriptional regulator [Sporolactobacillus shoreae]|uniref:MarR family transcriptional regulator n=1 Tax=Sporolactobacillus shoreae TaxID=1465501 RepID=A0A4Z0GKX2_9BACL|nr:MarR family transcriptional regulator [Sporolactobacillus shoreae]TGA97616.1 MarR family transcriptional regulator [Sporolactobacillus shoreae]
MELDSIQTLIKDYLELSVFTKNQVRETVEEMTREHFITFEQFCMMRLIEQHPGISPIQIAERLDINKSGVSIRISRLLDKKFIEKRKIDNRSFGLYNSEKGHAIFNEGEKKIQSLVEKWIQELGEQDSREFIRIYKKINTIITRLRAEK